ncbi:MAG: long-chain fatty acid--CoA ligase [Burkholderiales bacterium]
MPFKRSPHWPAGLPHHLTIPETSLYYNLEVSAARYPNKDAIVYYDSKITFAELNAQATKLAGFLQQQCGIKRGDRVLLYMQNSPQFVIAYYAILRADAMVVPVNPMNLTAELKHYIDDADATTAIAGQELFPQIQPHIGTTLLKQVIVATYSDYLTAATDLKVPDFIQAPRIEHNQIGVTAWRTALDKALQAFSHTAGPTDLCVMPYTSGTTGKPKGCIHIHSSVMMTTITHGAWLGAGSADAVILAVLPFFHVTGMQGSMNGPIYWGQTIVLLPRWDREVAAQMVQRYKITGWTNIPTMVIDFLMNPKITEYDLSSITRVGGGGAAMPEAIAQKLQDLCKLTYVEGYGLSETIAPTHINPADRPKKQCLGIPIFDTDARVINPATLQELGPNEVGEIISHGPQIFQGYWKNQKATDECFIELEGKRFFRTGDLGRVDEEGYFFIVDRLKRMINASGFKVWPAEVEAMMYQNPNIQEACIIGTQDAYRGETVKAIVMLKEASRGKISEQDIIDWAKANMAAYKYPRVIEFRDAALPKSATGKVQWRMLQEQENAKFSQPIG